MSTIHSAPAFDSPKQQSYPQPPISISATSSNNEHFSPTTIVMPPHVYMKTSKKPTKKNEEGRNTGRWTEEEHIMFLDGLQRFGREWKKVSALIKTRSPAQIRSHAQKYFFKLKEDPGKQIKKRANAEAKKLQKALNKADIRAKAAKKKAFKQRLKKQQREEMREKKRQDREKKKTSGNKRSLRKRSSSSIGFSKSTEKDNMGTTTCSFDVIDDTPRRLRRRRFSPRSTNRRRSQSFSKTNEISKVPIIQNRRRLKSVEIPLSNNYESEIKDNAQASFNQIKRTRSKTQKPKTIGEGFEHIVSSMRCTDETIRLLLSKRKSLSTEFLKNCHEAETQAQQRVKLDQTAIELGLPLMSVEQIETKIHPGNSRCNNKSSSFGIIPFGGGDTKSEQIDSPRCSEMEKWCSQNNKTKEERLATLRTSQRMRAAIAAIDAEIRRQFRDARQLAINPDTSGLVSHAWLSSLANFIKDKQAEMGVPDRQATGLYTLHLDKYQHVSIDSKTDEPFVVEDKNNETKTENIDPSSPNKQTIYIQASMGSRKRLRQLHDEEWCAIEVLTGHASQMKASLPLKSSSLFSTENNDKISRNDISKQIPEPLYPDFTAGDGELKYYSPRVISRKNTRRRSLSWPLSTLREGYNYLICNKSFLASSFSKVRYYHTRTVWARELIKH